MVLFKINKLLFKVMHKYIENNFQSVLVSKYSKNIDV